MVLQLNGVTKSFGVTEVLKDVTLTIEEGEKCALIGVNGAGKTTVMKIITGESERDGGEMALKKGASVAYLAQMGALDPDKTIEEEIFAVFAPLVRAEAEIAALEEEMSDLGDGITESIIERHHRLLERFERDGGYEYRSRARGALNGLGFAKDDFNRKVSTFSGGQKTKAALCKLLLTPADLLLLDEPTNHLDIANVEWLENFIRNCPGAVVVVSHDRYFLDRAVTKIIEVENGKTTTYNGDYAHYAYRKAAEREAALEQFARQQKYIKREEEIIRRFHSWATEKMHKKAQSREKRLEKVERAEKPEALPDHIKLTLATRRKSGNDVLSVKDLKKSWGNVKLFENVSFEVKRGEKVAIIGANGIGKTTLLNMLMNVQAEGLERFVKFGTNVEPAYFDQEYLRLNEEKTVFDEISDSFPTLTNLEIRDALAAFVFTGDDVFKKIELLSGGEKGRVAIAKLMLSNSNLLLLDEPTNHMDIAGKEILETALRAYEGTAVYVSHDRWFVNGTADKILELTASGVVEYVGDYDYYVEKKRYLAELAALNATEPQQTEVTEAERPEWQTKKVNKAEERRKAADTRRLEKAIAEREAEIAELDELLSGEAGSVAETVQKAFEEKAALEGELEALYDEYYAR